MSREVRFQLAQSGVEPRVGDQTAGARVVGMTFVGPGREDDGRAPLADHLDDLQFLFAACAQLAISEVQLFTEGSPEDLRSFGGLAGADLRGSTRPHLAMGEVDDSDTALFTSHPHDGAATGKLEIVRVGCKEERIHGFFQSFHHFNTSSRATDRLKAE